MESRYVEFMKTKPYLPHDMGGRLTEAIVAKAREELGETEEVKAKTIPELRKLIEAEKDLVSPTDDAFLLQYLRARKFNVKKAFSLLKNYYTVKKSSEDLYGQFDTVAMRRAFALKVGFVLPYRDEEGCAVALISMRKWDIDVTNAAEAITTLTIVALMVCQEPANQICGVKLLVDVRGASVKQIRGLIPRYVILLAKAFTNCLPIRFKGFHLYNESPIFTHMISFMKLFMTEKMKNRFHLHGDSQKNLHKHIPKAVLPAEDFGGDNTGDLGEWFALEMEKHFDMFRNFTTYGYRQ